MAVLTAGLLRSFRSLSTKTFYQTTPIFYVNANPHLGHLYSMLIADTRIRWEKLNPKAKTFFTTGTDEHGLKIQAVAEAQNVHPKDLVDRVSQNFKKLANDLNIDYDRFIRTTDEDHLEAVKYFWNLMMEKGLIYQGKHSGWYSISDEAFYPETQIEKNPETGKMVSKETRSEVIFQEETNYFFKLAQFQSQLIKYYEEHPDFIIPRSKQVALLNDLKENKLEDLSISRPSSRLTWGVEVPNDSSQKIYVWFDALLNYITSCGYPNQAFFDKKTTAWPAEQIIGKDIARFHCVYWPIFLMAAEIEVPDKLVVHAHWLCDGFKMSKSLGNVVDPQETAAYYGKDSLRFFLMEYSNLESDCNYREELFYYSREKLIGKYANLMTRCGGNAFNITESAQFYGQGKYDDIESVLDSYAIKSDVAEIKKVSAILNTSANNLYEVMNSKMVQYDHSKAVLEWWNVIESANQLLQLGQPWLYVNELKKNKDSLSDEQIEGYTILKNYFTFLAAEVSRISSILINPLIPELSSKILDRLSVAESKRNAEFCAIGKDLEYGAGANEKTHKIPIERVPLRETKK